MAGVNSPRGMRGGGERRWAVFYGIGYTGREDGRSKKSGQEGILRASQRKPPPGLWVLAFGVAAGTKDARRQGRGFR